MTKPTQKEQFFALQSENKALREENRCLGSENFDKGMEIAELHEALEFYANPENYIKTPIFSSHQDQITGLRVQHYNQNVIDDQGQRARKALGEK